MPFLSKFFAQTLAALQKAALFADDALFFGGVAVLVAANYQVNALFGQYTLGLALIVAGLLVGRARAKGGRQ